ncbi:MAG: putative glycoside hydrolase [Desulfomonilia bacterium]|jgi:hypothetical protein
MKIKLIAIVLCSIFLMGANGPIQPTYTVQSGDTLSKIAARYMPYTAAYTKRELITNIKDINKINGALSLGQSLSIPVVYNQPLKPKTITKPKDFTARGLYMNPSSAGTHFILDSATRLRKFSGNTLVFDAKDDSGAITFPSTIRAKYCPNEKYTPNIEELPKMIEYLHRMGIHVAARVVVFRDPIMSRVKPEWCINREKQWLNPENPEVQEYILTVVRELADNGLDEIQLDYVRYFADGKTTTGKEGVQRTDVIAGLLKKVHEITAPRGILLSMDMFGIVIWQRDVDVLVVGQDVTKIKSYVDIISPMLYPSHFSAGFAGVKNPADDPYRFVFSGIKRMKELVGEEVVIRPWLQSFPLRVTRGFGPKYIQTQIKAANDAGGTGWLLWSPGNHYTYAYVAMQNLPKPKPEVHEAGVGTKTMEPKQPTPLKNTSPLPTVQPVGANQQTPPEPKPGVKS